MLTFIRKLLARILGLAYLLLGALSLLGLLVPDVREQVISLGAVVFRYGAFVVIGIGLLMLRKWSAYLWAGLMIVNLVFVYTVYEGQTMQLDGYMSLLPWVGPLLTAIFFAFIWSVLGPIESTESDGNDA